MEMAVRKGSGNFFHSNRHDVYYVINMGNSIIGVSILAMPWCFAQVGMILATLLLVFGAILTRISCNNLLDAASVNRRSGYEFLALATCGRWGKLAVEVCTIGYLLGVCVAFLVTMADLLTPLACRLFSLQESIAIRAVILIVVTLLIALPLSLIEKMEKLSSLSALSMAFYALLACKIGLDAWGRSLPESWSGNLSVLKVDKFLSVFPIFATGLSCQTQVFVMYDTLPESSPARMKNIIGDAINMCMLLYWSVGMFGYLAFNGDGVEGNILLNLEASLLSDIVKLLYALTVAISFPLCIFPCRRSVQTLCFPPDGLEVMASDQLVRRSRLTTLVLVLLTLTASLLIPDIETILSLSGGTMGSFICFVLPALIVFRTDMLLSGALSSFALATSWVILTVGFMMLTACFYQVLFVAYLYPWLWAFSSHTALPSQDLPNDQPK